MKQRIWAFDKGQDEKGYYVYVGFPSGEGYKIYVSKEAHDRTLIKMRKKNV